MYGNSESIRAAYWFDLGQSDALHGRARLALILTLVGDDIATRSYLDGWRSGEARIAA